MVIVRGITATHAPRTQVCGVRYFCYFSLVCRCVNRKLQFFCIAVHRSPCATCIHQGLLGKTSRAKARVTLAVLWVERVLLFVMNERKNETGHTQERDRQLIKRSDVCTGWLLSTIGFYSSRLHQWNRGVSPLCHQARQEYRVKSTFESN